MRLRCGARKADATLSIAAFMQRIISGLNNPFVIRIWLSRGCPKKDKGYLDLPLESSVAAVGLLDLPVTLLLYALFTYVIGFGLYLIFSWLETPSPDQHDYRNIFIAFCGVLALFLIWVFILIFISVQESRQMMRSLGRSRSNRRIDQNMLVDLQQRLNRIQREQRPEANRKAFDHNLQDEMLDFFRRDKAGQNRSSLSPSGRSTSRRFSKDASNARIRVKSPDDRKAETNHGKEKGHLQV